MVETSDEWIVERTGIRERRIAEPESGRERHRAARRSGGSRAGRSARRGRRPARRRDCDARHDLSCHRVASSPTSSAPPGGSVRPSRQAAPASSTRLLRLTAALAGGLAQRALVSAPRRFEDHQLERPLDLHPFRRRRGGGGRRASDGRRLRGLRVGRRRLGWPGPLRPRGRLSDADHRRRPSTRSSSTSG